MGSINITGGTITAKRGKSCTKTEVIPKIEPEPAPTPEPKPEPEPAPTPSPAPKAKTVLVAKGIASGKVTAKAKGKAVIYVQTINGIWKTCKVTVK